MTSEAENVKETVVDARDRFVDELDGIRGSLHEEWGWAPRGARWILPAIAVVAGLTAGGFLRRRWRRRR